MEQFKESIEEIVAPLRAPGREKNNLRRELWAHFCALVENERNQGIEDRVARANALARLGTPDEIRAAFNDSLHPNTRALYRLDYYMRRKADEDSPRYAAVIAGAIFVASLFISSVAILGCSWRDPKFTSERFLMLGALFSSLCLWQSIWIFLAFMRESQWEQAARTFLYKNQGSAEFIRVILVHLGRGVLLGALFLCLGYLPLVWILGRFHAETISYLYVAPFLFAFFTLNHGAVLPYAVFRGEQHAQYIQDWPYQDE